jgi:hypothetical protein
VAGFNQIVGSTLAWLKVSATGGLCVNDVVATLTTTGGTGGCYKLTAITDTHMYTQLTDQTGTASINQTTGQYPSGTTVYFSIEKVCALSVREAVNWSLQWHL